MHDLGAFLPGRSSILQFGAPPIRLLKVKLVFWVEGGEVGGPALSGPVGVADCSEGGGNVRKWCGLPAENGFDGSPDVEAFRSTELGRTAVGGGEGASGAR